MHVVHVEKPSDPRAALAGALARMQESSDALVAKLSEDNLRRYVDAANAARVAFEAMVLAGFERAKLARGGR